MDFKDLFDLLKSSYPQINQYIFTRISLLLKNKCYDWKAKMGVEFIVEYNHTECKSKIFCFKKCIMINSNYKAVREAFVNPIIFQQWLQENSEFKFLFISHLENLISAFILPIKIFSLTFQFPLSKLFFETPRRNCFICILRNVKSNITNLIIFEVRYYRRNESLIQIIIEISPNLKLFSKIIAEKIAQFFFNCTNNIGNILLNKVYTENSLLSIENIFFTLSNDEQQFKGHKYDDKFKICREMFTLEEDDKFQKLKNILISQHQEIDDHLILRCLHGRNFCIDKAIDLFNFVCTWRKNFKPELLQISHFASDYNRKIMRLIVDPVSKRSIIFGRICQYIPSETADKKIIEYLIYMMENGLKILPKHLDKYIVIADLKGSSMANINLKLMKEMIPILQDSYPGSMLYFYALNTSYFVQLIYKICCPFIHPVTRQKIFFLTENEIDKLYEVIDRSSLPPEFKGTADPSILN